jgi:subtilisin family serine protease
VLNAAGTSILAAGDDTQDGTQDPFEIACRDANCSVAFPVNSRIVIVKFNGAARAFHLDTNRGTLSIATSGSTYGHNAGLNTVTMAATYWNSAKTGLRPFTGFANPNESFSSDGPRKIFFTPDGTAITPGNFLFATNGGQTLQKPDLAAADGVTTHTPGFLPFFGTSAATPHAAGIAALVRSARPDYTVAQTKTAMTATALDSMESGVDRDSGFGITMANAAVQYALTH